jgi:O-antigen/teichoic acid export membrane protein
MRTIFLNTAALYLKTGLTVVLSLLASRWTLEALGATDLGIVAVIGGVTGFLTILVSAMSSTSQRFLSHAIGTRDARLLGESFKACIVIQLCGGVVVLLLGEIIGGYLVRNILQLPDAARDIALLVLRLNLLVTALSIVALPFSAMFIARQKIAVLAALDVAGAVAACTLAASLHLFLEERLFFYATLTAIIGVTFVLTQIALALALFKELGPALRVKYSLNHLRVQLGFSAWTLMGALGSACTRKGSPILLNLFFGTQVNAAYLVAEQAANHASTLSSNLSRSAHPEIVAMEGRTQRELAIELSVATTRYASLLTLLWLVPLAFNIESALELWLHQPPPLTAGFALLLFAVVLFDNLSSGYPILIQSIGRIARYQMVVGGVMVMALPMAWGLLSLGFSPLCVPASVAAITFVQMFVRIGFASRLAGLNPRRWWSEILVPVATAALPAVAASLLLARYLPAAEWNFLVTFPLAVLATMLCLWQFGLQKTERDLIRHTLLMTGRA